MNKEFKADPLAPYINGDGKAFNGNWKAFAPAASIFAVIGVSAVCLAAGALLGMIF